MREKGTGVNLATAPTAKSEASTSTMNARVASGRVRTGAEVKRHFGSLGSPNKASAFALVRAESGAATEL